MQSWAFVGNLRYPGSKSNFQANLNIKIIQHWAMSIKIAHPKSNLPYKKGKK